MVGRAVTDGRGGLRPDVGQGLLLSVVVRESGTVIESTFTCGLISECWGVTSCACLIVLVCKSEQPIEFAEPEAYLPKSPIAGLGDANPLKYSASPAKRFEDGGFSAVKISNYHVNDTRKLFWHCSRSASFAVSHSGKRICV